VTTAVVPVRSFDGLTRLSGALDDLARRDLMRRLAARTAAVAAETGISVVVVTGDRAVRAWAEESGYDVATEPVSGGLDAAARIGTAAVDGPWLVVHADLPWVATADIEAAFGAVDRAGAVLAPSHDGGTSLIGSAGSDFPFAYGVGSFRRHLAAAPRAAVLVRPGLALDLDRVRDLATLRTLADRRDGPSLV
jgi:2-phospho-L-lactate/phosphoenolpyruvate guanylyltransferase